MSTPFEIFLLLALATILFWSLIELHDAAKHKHRSYPMPNEKPLRPIASSEIRLVAMKITLREAARLNILTKEALEHISARADEIVAAFHGGKIVEVHKDNSITIRDPDPETEDPELRNNPDYPMYNKSKKTLDI